MASGGWFRWEDIEMIGRQALRQDRLIDQEYFCLRTACLVSTIGDARQLRFSSFPVVIGKDTTRTTQKGKRKPNHERFQRAFGTRAMSGHANVADLQVAPPQLRIGQS